ncbi:hypothetical protein JRQ81_008866 [Phrynocephalus forsythii]|uniref:Protein phosphatase 1 regulatory subunit 26 N-terminal domain-containing protein n=1 Tax=Phrynocephalus forsythii TaxID=171643 RepID=A0A9Q1AT20_9SAUR|nr:hypothetical protein JRQ81_008866 [Phrynocephalus forsythii]
MQRRTAEGGPREDRSSNRKNNLAGEILTDLFLRLGVASGLVARNVAADCPCSILVALFHAHFGIEAPPHRVRKHLRQQSSLRALLLEKMFLTNPSPSVALPRTLEPSSHPRGSRYPVSSSEPEGDLARATVSTEAQRVTSSNLPSEEASLGRSRACGHLLQEEPKARGRKPRGGPQTLQRRMAGSNGLEVEEGSEYDSDDSVDREIEEAIQEYLRGKGPDGQPLAEREADEKVVQEERSAPDPAGSTFHAEVGAAEIQQERASEDPESKGAEKWSLPPPSSLSSTSYFGQNAPAETEEFSSERKEQARKRRRRRGRRDNNPWDGKEARDTPALGSQEEETHQENQRREDPVALFSRWNPELQGPQGSACGESRSNEELAGSRKPAGHCLGRPWLALPSDGAEEAKNGKSQGKPELEITLRLI